MASERSALIEGILQAQQHLSRALYASSKQIWIELDLSTAQLKTLIALYDAGAPPIGQVAEMLGIGQPTASHLIDRLVQTGFVVRTEDPEDRRRTLAELSPQGVKLVEQLRELRSEPLQRWLAQLDDPALAALHLGFQALADVAQAETLPISEGP